MKLGDVCTFDRGLTYSKADEVANSSNGVLRSNNIDLVSNTLCLDEIKYIREDIDIPESKKTKKGSILICMANGSKCHLGKVAIIDIEEVFAFGGFMGLITPTETISSKYLYYSLITPKYKKLIASLSDGANINNLKFRDIQDFEIPVPSLPEQERIVKILDAAFEKIDRLKENAEKGLQEVKDLWQATVTKELSHREGWTETTIGDICEIVRGKRFVRADIVENGVPCIHYGDMYTHYGMSATKAKGCVSPELAKKLRFANKNDVVVVAAGENKYDIGVGMVWLGSEPAVVHDACFILKHSQNPMFLSYYFRSTPYHQYLKDEVNEGKICSFLTKPLAEAKISLPPLAVQNEIVKKLDDVRDRVEKLIANYKETIDSYAPLKQAILRKAFSGEL